MRKYTLIPIIFILLLAACNLPSSQTATPDAAMIITEAAATAAVQLSQTAALNPQASATAPVVATKAPTQPASTVEAPAAATATAQPTSAPVQSGSGDAASFVADVTAPDDTYAAPGAVFEKIWRIKNTGSTTWTPAYGLIWLQGDKMNSPDKISIPKEVRPGEEVDVSVTLTAPTTAGSHQTYFRLQNASNQTFRLDGSGDLWVKIIVGLPSTSTPTPEGTQTGDPTPQASETPES